MTKSIFADRLQANYPFTFDVRIEIDEGNSLHGGVPADPKTIAGWLKNRLELGDQELANRVALTMAERGIEDITEAVEKVAEQNVNGFKRDPDNGGLYIEQRNLRGAIVEGASIAVAGGYLKKAGWGVTNKGVLSFLKEHIVVPADRYFLKRPDGALVTEADGVDVRFIPKFVQGKGLISAIAAEEFVAYPLAVDFVLLCDYDFGDEDWSKIWIKSEKAGLGAARAQGFGRFAVTRFEQRGGGK